MPPCPSSFWPRSERTLASSRVFVDATASASLADSLAILMNSSDSVNCGSIRPSSSPSLTVLPSLSGEYQRVAGTERVHARDDRRVRFRNGGRRVLLRFAAILPGVVGVLGR